jgi:sulfonate transport system substrate-binding protein
MMAAAEVESGARLFFRKPEANTWGVLNVREEFAKANPALVKRVLTVYETARKWCLAHPAELKASMMAATKLSDPVISKQLERTDISSGKIGAVQAATIVEAGKALQAAGVLDDKLDMAAVANGMIDASFLPA